MVLAKTLFRALVLVLVNFIHLEQLRELSDRLQISEAKLEGIHVVLPLINYLGRSFAQYLRSSVLGSCSSNSLTLSKK